MKACFVLLIIVLSLPTNIFSQVQFASRTIVGGEYRADGARSVYAVDVDGDGDMDVLSASRDDNKIAWYESDLVSSVAILNEIPIEFNLSQNYPNPFNPITTIKYKIPELNFVTLKVYDVLGREVTILINEEKPIGSYEVEFNATNLPSGVYFYSLQAGSFVETKKMVLMK